MFPQDDVPLQGRAMSMASTLCLGGPPTGRGDFPFKIAHATCRSRGAGIPDVTWQTSAGHFTSPSLDLIDFLQPAHTTLFPPHALPLTFPASHFRLFLTTHQHLAWSVAAHFIQVLGHSPWAVALIDSHTQFPLKLRRILFASTFTLAFHNFFLHNWVAAQWPQYVFPTAPQGHRALVPCLPHHHAILRASFLSLFFPFPHHG